MFYHFQMLWLVDGNVNRNGSILDQNTTALQQDISTVYHNQPVKKSGLARILDIS